MKEIFTEELVVLNVNSITKNEVILELSELLKEQGKISDVDLYVNDVLLREQEVSTELENGVAMPHARSSAVIKPAVVIAISKEGICFSQSGKKSHIIVQIAMPAEASKEHIQLLSQITGVLIEEEKIQQIIDAKSKAEIVQIFKGEKRMEKVNSNVFLIGATGCASGVAHTYLAAKALEKAANAQGAQMKVETNGSIGVENSPTPSEIEKATCVIIASDKDVEMTRFAGKKIIYASVKEGINDADKLIQRAINGDGSVYQGQLNTSVNSKSDESKGRVYKALMNGVSFMIPFVVVAGLLCAFAFAFGGTVSDGGLVLEEGSFWFQMNEIASIGFKLMIPMLAGYIAYGIGDRAALAPGVIGGWIANDGSYFGATSGAGFIGAIIAGLIAGYLVYYIRKVKVPNSIAALMPIVVIPVVATVIVALLFMFVIGAPIASMMDAMFNMLRSLEGGSLIVLGIVMGLMQGFDMGGPVGKTLLMFSLALMAEGELQYMGAQAMAIPVAPLGMAIATIIDRKNKLFTKEESANGKAAVVMGFVGISEGAIPFAVADPLAVIPANMIGSAVAATMGLLFAITDPIAWGGPIIVVLGLTNNPVMAIVSMLAGSFVTAFVCLGLKRFFRNRAKNA